MIGNRSFSLIRGNEPLAKTTWVHVGRGKVRPTCSSLDDPEYILPVSKPKPILLGPSLDLSEVEAVQVQLKVQYEVQESRWREAGLWGAASLSCKYLVHAPAISAELLMEP
jgi:hypothetical protein